MTDGPFEALFHRLAATRHRYEVTRIGNGSFAERAHLLDELHDLRAQMATIRGAHGPMLTAHS